VTRKNPGGWAQKKVEGHVGCHRGSSFES
jgi:hypothetical protein